MGKNAGIFNYLYSYPIASFNLAAGGEALLENPNMELAIWSKNSALAVIHSQLN